MHACTSQGTGSNLAIGMPSGILVANALVMRKDGKWFVKLVTLMRTQRRLFDGFVYARASALK